VVSDSQDKADAIAHSLACKEAQKKVICLDTFNEFACADPLFSDLEYEFTFTAITNNPPLTWSISGGSLPPGIVLETTGELHGWPYQPGVYDFTVTATDAAGNSSNNSSTFQVFGITGGSVLTAAKSCEDYSNQLQSSGGDGATTYSIDPNLAPSWVSVSSSGLVTGKPSQSDAQIDFLFEIVLTDESGHTCNQEVSIFVGDYAADCFDSGNPPDADIIAGNPYSFQLIPHQPTTSVYGYTISAGSLPNGLAIGPATGLISGQATVAGAFTFTVSLIGVCWPCSKEYTITAKCHATISDVPPTVPLFTLTGPGAQLASAGPYYIVQRTGAGKNITFSALANVKTSASTSWNWHTALYNDETSAFIGNFGGDATSGGPAGSCNTVGPLNNSGTVSLDSCTRYRLEPHLQQTGTNTVPCTSSAQITIAWT
jgi:hypothetical protein